MLRRKNKRRYLAVMYDPNTSQTQVKGDIQGRFMELFGSIATELAYLRAYHSIQNGILIMSCDLEYLERILFTIAMMESANDCCDDVRNYKEASGTSDSK